MFGLLMALLGIGVSTVEGVKTEMFNIQSKETSPNETYIDFYGAQRDKITNRKVTIRFNSITGRREMYDLKTRRFMRDIDLQKNIEEGKKLKKIGAFAVQSANYRAKPNFDWKQYFKGYLYTTDPENHPYGHIIIIEFGNRTYYYDFEQDKYIQSTGGQRWRDLEEKEHRKNHGLESISSYEEIDKKNLKFLENDNITRPPWASSNNVTPQSEVLTVEQYKRILEEWR